MCFPRVTPSVSVSLHTPFPSSRSTSKLTWHCPPAPSKEPAHLQHLHAPAATVSVQAACRGHRGDCPGVGKPAHNSGLPGPSRGLQAPNSAFSCPCRGCLTLAGTSFTLTNETCQLSLKNTLQICSCEHIPRFWGVSLQIPNSYFKLRQDRNLEIVISTLTT